jgi:hypothetical protein
MASNKRLACWSKDRIRKTISDTTKWMLAFHLQVLSVKMLARSVELNRHVEQLKQHQKVLQSW